VTARARSPSVSSWLHRIWYGGAPAPWPLRWLAALFALGAGVRAAAYRRGWRRPRQLGVPLIVVGNISVGGTGKTPLVLWLVHRLQARGLHPGIVTRGYGGQARRPRRVQAASSALEVGDEALLLYQRGGCPVAVGRDRVRAARLLLRAQVNVIVADDGLQHLRLARDLEIAVVDGSRGGGNGRCGGWRAWTRWS
jgi:tetraacyldisaccharide 4'-kinase